MDTDSYFSPLYEILKAYSFLEKTTPLKYDCGELCSGKCCKGDDSDGMWLFPFEKELYKGNNKFRTESCEENFGYNKLICSGLCDRKSRPLACRMFPLFPYVFQDEHGNYIINVLMDIRAKEVCPLSFDKIDLNFKRSVRLAAKALIRDKDMAQYLMNVTQLLTYNPF